MFVQIIQGRVRDAVGAREAWNEWVEWRGLIRDIAYYDITDPWLAGP